MNGSRWDDYLTWSTSLVEAPTEEPLDLAEVKMQVRREFVTDDDEFLETILIPSVRDRAETCTDRQLITATWALRLDRFPCGRYIEIPKPPLQMVTSVTYIDSNGDEQELSEYSYTVDAPVGARCARGRVTLNFGEVWPTTRYWDDPAVTVTFVAGYGATAESIPPFLKRALLLDIGTAYEHREDMIVGQGYAISPFPLDASAIYGQLKSWSRG